MGCALEDPAALLRSHAETYLAAPKRLTGTAPHFGRLSAVG
jgi:hypothetical protein